MGVIQSEDGAGKRRHESYLCDGFVVRKPELVKKLGRHKSRDLGGALRQQSSRVDWYPLRRNVLHELVTEDILANRNEDSCA